MVQLLRLVLLAVLITGCAGRAQEPAGGMPGVEPTLVVERFLRAANVNDWETMANLFGNREGSILRRDPRSEVEQRMFIIASILRHKDFELQSESMVPGRVGEAVRVVTRLEFDERSVPVPFVLVRSRNGAWLIEMVDLEAVTRR